LDEIDAIDEPFDQAILGDDDSPSRKHILAAIEALQTFRDTLDLAAKDINVKLELNE
jgi:hypothetical protein